MMKANLDINTIAKYGCALIGVIYLSICAYFMLYNAFWIPGDEAIVMNATGWGHAFVPPREPFSIGRFFPFSYSLYNILLLLPHETQISITSIYILHIVAMFVYAALMTIFSLQILKGINDKWRFPITLFLVIFAVSRIYQEFVTCYTAVWMVYFLLPMFLWCSWRYIETKKLFFAILALVVINYIMYCYEMVFTIPMSIGTFALIFSYKTLSKKERRFYASLVSSAVLFLLLYVVLVIPQIKVAYDGSHGTNVSVFINAIYIFIAQKPMWIVVSLLAYRIYDCVKNKISVCFFDYLLFASCAYCCGAAVLKLNFIYYYNGAVIIAIPAILYFGKHYLKSFGVCVLFLLLAGFYSAKLPRIINKNQGLRITYKANMDKFANYITNGESAYWYIPNNTKMSNFDTESRIWRHGYTESGIGWVLVNENFALPERSKYTGEKGLWFVVDADTITFIEETTYQSLLYANDGIKCYLVK